MVSSRTHASLLLVVVGAAASIVAPARLARAQTTSVIYDVAVNPQSESDWRSSVSVEPGTTVYVRMRVRLNGATALGLAGMTHQPTLDNWRAENGDSLVPFTMPGLNNACPPGPTTETEFVGRHVFPEPQTNTGRMFPFGAPGSFGHIPFTSHVDPGNVLRFAQSKATTPTINTAWGVTSSQLTHALNGPCFVAGSEVVLFRFGVTLSASDASARVLSPGNAAISQNRSTWWMNAAGTQTLNAPMGEIVNATITVVPSPGPLGLFACVCVPLGRRGRRGITPVWRLP